MNSWLKPCHKLCGVVGKPLFLSLCLLLLQNKVNNTFLLYIARVVFVRSSVTVMKDREIVTKQQYFHILFRNSENLEKVSGKQRKALCLFINDELYFRFGKLLTCQSVYKFNIIVAWAISVLILT